MTELEVPDGSPLIGQSAMSCLLRKAHGLALLAIHRGGETPGYEHGLREIPFQAGDRLVVHTEWHNLARIVSNRDFVVVTTEYAHQEVRPQKVVPALCSLGAAAWIAQQILAFIGEVGSIQF